MLASDYYYPAPLVAALNRASILTDEAARRVARSHGEARTTYHRASKDLWAMLDREQEGSPAPAGEDGQADAADAPDAVAEPAQEPVAAVSVPAARVEVDRTQNEPEDSAWFKVR